MKKSVGPAIPVVNDKVCWSAGRQSKLVPRSAECSRPGLLVRGRRCPENGIGAYDFEFHLFKPVSAGNEDNTFTTGVKCQLCNTTVRWQ